MTDELRGKTLQDAEAMFGVFHDVVTDDSSAEMDVDALGKLAVFSGVREFPVRVKCAVLPWHALRAALRSKDGASVTTE
jgi:nitrogen fixation NifU-like protein